MAQPPRDHVFVKTSKPKAAAAARIGAGLADRERGELLGRLRWCFARTGTWLQAGKYVSALVSEMPNRRRPGERRGRPDGTRKPGADRRWPTGDQQPSRRPPRGYRRAAVRCLRAAVCE